MKAWFKKNYKLAEYMQFDKFLELGLRSVKDRAKNHFVRSQIGMPIREGEDDDYYYD